MSDDQEFMEVATATTNKVSPKYSDSQASEPPSEKAGESGSVARLCQYSMVGEGFIPTNKTVPKLPPGVYHLIFIQNTGWIFEPMAMVTDNLLQLPDSKSEEVLKEITRFWSLKDKFTEYGFVHKRGVLMWGPPGCHAAGTDILMYDGSFKKVEDVAVGDRLMGPDSTSRTVLDLRRGREEMLRVTPTRGNAFDVNASHILSLVRSHKADTRYPSVVNTTVREYMHLTQCSQRSFKLRHSDIVDFPSTGEDLPIDPYVLGTWFGDGTTGKPEIASMDPEIIDAWRRRLGVLEDKNVGIPAAYLRASVADRLQVLAGLIDTDGSYSTVMWRESAKLDTSMDGKRNFTFVQKSPKITEDFVFLARSLGFSCSVRKITKSIKSTGFTGNYFSVSLGGDLSRIPVRLPRKQASKGTPNKDHLRVGIDSIESLGVGDYYGFTLSGDHLYMDGNFVVHHNSGKTATVSLVSQKMVQAGGIVIFADVNPEHLGPNLVSLREVEPDRPVVVVLEDIDTIIQRYGESKVLAILDGESSIGNVTFVATTNYPENLDGRVINRPSRFDRVVKVGMPNDAAREMYIRSRGIEDNIEKWVELTENFSIAHIKELIVGVKCFGDPLEDVAKRLKVMAKPPKSGGGDKGLGFGGGD